MVQTASNMTNKQLLQYLHITDILKCKQMCLKRTIGNLGVHIRQNTHAHVTTIKCCHVVHYH